MSAGEFLFVGGHPALDFVNTWTVDRGATVERLGDFGALLRWARAARLLGTVDADVALARWAAHPDGAALLGEAVALREATRRWLRDRRQAEPVRALADAQLARRGVKARLVLDGARFVREYWVDDRGPEVLLLGLGNNVTRLLCDVDRDAVRACESRDCEAWFHVEGRTTRRAWCSPERCGNRQRAARYDAEVRRRPYRI